MKENKSAAKKAKLLASERKCEKCGAILSDEDVMKVKFENGSWETIPLPLCPRCFKERMRLLAHNRENNLNRSP